MTLFFLFDSRQHFLLVQRTCEEPRWPDPVTVSPVVLCFTPTNQIWKNRGSDTKPNKTNQRQLLTFAFDTKWKWSQWSRTCVAQNACFFRTFEFDTNWWEWKSRFVLWHCFHLSLEHSFHLVIFSSFSRSRDFLLNVFWIRFIVAPLFPQDTPSISPSFPLFQDRLTFSEGVHGK